MLQLSQFSSKMAPEAECHLKRSIKSGKLVITNFLGYFYNQHGKEIRKAYQQKLHLKTPGFWEV
jgi:hypothetical protein